MSLRQDLLRALLEEIDALGSSGPHVHGRTTIEALWSGRLALLGERVAYSYAGRRLTGVLEAASLSDGLLIRDPEAGPIWREAAVLTDLTPCEP